jgi:hypothetical protein
LRILDVFLLATLARPCATNRAGHSVRTRNDLLNLIAEAIRLQLAYLPKKQGMAFVDTIEGGKRP